MPAVVHGSMKLPTHMRRFHPITNTSLATRLALVALAVTLGSLAATATVGLQRGSDLANDIADDRLVAIAAARTDTIELSLISLRREVSALALSPAVRDAVLRLAAAHAELAAPAPAPSAVAELTAHYVANVVPRLERVRSTPVGVSFLIPDDDPAAIRLQTAYIADGDAGVAEPSLVLDPGDGSTYSTIHPAIHRTAEQIAVTSGFDDLYLISADGNRIVYSLRKRIDFATSLAAGPHSGSALARLVDTIAADPEAGARLTDFGAYAPAFDRPIAFVASAVLDDDGQLVGYLAGALSVDHVDQLLAGAGAWRGFGETGDAYLSGADGTMRSTVRRFQESASQFLASAPEAGVGELSDAQRRRMAETGTTALVQSVNRRLLTDADAGPAIADAINFRGEQVRVATRPVAVDDVDWVLFVEAASEELERPVEQYARRLLSAVALFVIVITFLVVRWSNGLVAPIRNIARRLRAAHHDGPAPDLDSRLDLDSGLDLDSDLDSHLDSDRGDGAIEYERLGEHVDQMLRTLSERRAAAVARNAERSELVRQFLPTAVARRSEEGDGHALDHVRNASVILLAVDGVGSLVGELDDQDVRDLLAEIVDEVDSLATDLGVERVKLTGTTYYAVCGVSRPLLDHAARSAAFALGAQDLVHELSDGRLAVRGGVHSGPLTVGLTTRGALVYDVWGATVSEAERLARSAGRHGVAVSASVREQLPAEFVVDREQNDGSAIVTDRVSVRVSS